METLTELERSVLEKATSGDDPSLKALRLQLSMTTALERQLTGVGFYTNLQVDPSSRPAPELRNFAISDVYAQVDGLDRGAGFVIYVRAGYLGQIEGFTFDETWPDQISGFSLFYMAEPRDPLEISQR